MELLQLRYFYESAESGSFAKTAERHYVPPSSVSASVKRLEQELGCQLFDRRSNRIVLNEKGRQLRSSLSIVFDELESVQRSFFEKKGEAVCLRLLVKGIRTRITRGIIEYRKVHPDTYFEMNFDFDAEPDAYDLIIDEASDRYTEYSRCVLCTVRVLISAALDHPLAGQHLTLRQLRHQPFVTMGEGSRMHQILLRACQNAGFMPKIVIQTNDATCYARCIAAGMGLAPVKYNGERKTSVYLQIDDFDEQQNFYIYYRENALCKEAREFLAFLRRMPQ